MTTIEKRALYNLLRMNWLHEPMLLVQPWQVEDYRQVPLTTLFNRLETFNIHLDRLSFITYADACGSPEDLTDHLIGDRPLQAADEDKIYLIVFELWRRLIPQKPSLSILCHELDYQIHLYDQQQMTDPLPLQEAIKGFIKILDENVDKGILPQETWKLILPYCANDVETFLYDFISEQIDEGLSSDSHELLNELDPYLGNNKWFQLLRLKLFKYARHKTAQKMTEQLMEEHLHEKDLDFDLEFLSILAEQGDQIHFPSLMKHLLPLITKEEDLHDLVAIVIDYFDLLDRKKDAIQWKSFLNKRSHHPLNAPVDLKDPDFHLVTDF
jgi:hypothetical protein